MATLYKTYWEKDGQEIKAYITFNKHPSSWVTGSAPIGYRCTVVPVKRTKLEGGLQMEESGAFTGFNDTLLEVDRQSKKRLETAIRVLEERKEMYIDHIMNKIQEK